MAPCHPRSPNYATDALNYGMWLLQRSRYGPTAARYRTIIPREGPSTLRHRAKLARIQKRRAEVDGQQLAVSIVAREEGENGIVTQTRSSPRPCIKVHAPEAGIGDINTREVNSVGAGEDVGSSVQNIEVYSFDSTGTEEPGTAPKKATDIDYLCLSNPNRTYKPSPPRTEAENRRVAESFLRNKWIDIYDWNRQMVKCEGCYGWIQVEDERGLSWYAWTTHENTCRRIELWKKAGLKEPPRKRPGAWREMLRTGNIDPLMYVSVVARDDLSYFLR